MNLSTLERSISGQNQKMDNLESKSPKSGRMDFAMISTVSAWVRKIFNVLIHIQVSESFSSAPKWTHRLTYHGYNPHHGLLKLTIVNLSYFMSFYGS